MDLRSCCAVLVGLVLLTRPEGDGEETQRWAAFEAWFAEQGGSRHAGVQLRTLPTFGRSVVAAHDIATGETLLSVPFSLVVDSADAPLATAAPEIRRILDEEFPLSATNENALLLLVHKNDPNSPWQRYIDVLPSTFSTTLFFSDDELSYLEGSSLHHFARQRRRAIESQYDTIFTPLFVDYPEHFAPEQFSLDAWKWALSVIWSRSFVVDEGKRGLVPWADMFNMAPETEQVKVAVDAVDHHLIYSARSPIKKGEQIFVAYGQSRQMSNAQLLMDYGFVLENNPHDAVVFPMTHSSSASPRKRGLLRAHDLDRDQFFVGPPALGEFPEHLLAAFRVTVATEQELDALLEQSAQGRQRLPSRVSRRNELAALRLLESNVRKLRASYPEHVMSRALGANARAALAVCQGEKRMWDQLLTQIQERRQRQTAAAL
ncbi:SET domain containing protein [Acanthamoeba castellanii str. Neff]|uniref:SET domain containing protein n=1 Tax=Acanthamoeba castellanii (strain ATCC 30010 / Neff) TaxID=1257118 RepID=L8H0P9_ACACF|nr:SET domain containing protein [Acanthamoeba castellanii str. Neff]ELR18348.1 SET domain containing protein [Acanthamoeba castellanii str. Neff]